MTLTERDCPRHMEQKVSEKGFPGETRNGGALTGRRGENQKEKKSSEFAMRLTKNRVVESKAVCLSVSKGTAMVTNLQQRKLFGKTLPFLSSLFHRRLISLNLQRIEPGMKRG